MQAKIQVMRVSRALARGPGGHLIVFFFSRYEKFKIQTQSEKKLCLYVNRPLYYI